MNKIISKSLEETKKLGIKIAGSCKKGDVIGLIGELGAGKTCFMQGFANGLNVPKSCYVSSPTFTIMKIYKGDLDIFHFDFYRLTEPEDVDNLGFDDYLKSGGIIVIEWADKFIEILPKETKKIYFKVVSENEREIVY